MEKSSKLINNILLSNINFNSFSQSKEWIGYFELGTDNKVDENYTHQAGLLVYNYFEKDWHNFFILSALSYDDDAIGDLNAYHIYKDVYQLAKQKGLLQEYSEEYDKYIYDEIPLPAKLVSICFDTTFILPFSEMVMSLAFGKVIGQVCFLINPRLQIALYPHEDIGYGCISLGDNPKNLLNFLDYCHNQPKFTSHINEKYQDY